MGRLAEMTEGRGEIRWTDEKAVDALDGGDGVDVGNRLLALDLDHHRDVVVDAREVVGHVAVPVAAVGGADAANAARRVAGRGDDGVGLFAALDERHEEVVEADVQKALDHDRLGRLGPRDGGARAVLQRHQLTDEGLKVVRRVLAVDEQPVEAGVAEDLGGDAVGQRSPATDEDLSGEQVLAKGVGNGNGRGGRHQWISGSGMGAPPSKKSKSQPSWACPMCSKKSRPYPRG